MDVIKFIQDLLRNDERFKNIDVSEGTVIYDLLIRPLSAIISNEINTNYIDGTASNLNINNYESMDIGALKRLASLHMVPLKTPSISYAKLKLKLSAPINYTIEKDTEFDYNGIVFKALSKYELTTDLNNYVKDGYYYIYYPIVVYNENGDVVPANSLGLMENAPSELLAIEHEAVVTGQKEDTNYELYQKIVHSIYNRQVLSKLSIMNYIKENVPSVKSVEVIGNGDPLMQRDIVYNLLIANEKQYKESNFEGKVRRNLNNPNKAYKLFRNSSNYLSDYIPVLADEYNQIEYNMIAFDDGATLDITTSEIVKEDFSQSNQIIGAMERILCNTVADSVYINVKNIEGFDSGNIIDLIDPTSATPTTSNIIKNVIEESLPIQSYDSVNHKITIIGQNYDYLRVGAYVWIYSNDTNNKKNGYITAISTNGTNTEVTVDFDINDVSVDVAFLKTNVIECYSNIGYVYDRNNSPYIQINLGDAGYIGTGWVKSDHGLPIGAYINNREAQVIGGKLVMGNNDMVDYVNIMQEIITRTGTDKFVKSIKDSLIINIITDDNQIIKLLDKTKIKIR